jgi:hypothetical protein
LPATTNLTHTALFGTSARAGKYRPIKSSRSRRTRLTTVTDTTIINATDDDEREEERKNVQGATALHIVERILGRFGAYTVMDVDTNSIEFTDVFIEWERPCMQVRVEEPGTLRFMALTTDRH